MHFSDADLLIGLEKAREIAVAKDGTGPYGLFEKELGAAHDQLRKLYAGCNGAEIVWHKDIGETKEAFAHAKNTYLKWRDMVVRSLPGTDLVRWEGSSATPDEIDVALDRLITVIEDNADMLKFSQPALEELHPLQDLLDTELDQDREALRLYRNTTVEKESAKTVAQGLFYKVRRFVRRDCGRNSVEYAQLRDKAVRKAREELQEKET